LRQTLIAYSQDRCGAHAAALAFYGFLSLIPFLLVLAAGVGIWLGSSKETWEQAFNYLLSTIFRSPTGGSVGPEISRFLQAMVDQSAVAGGVGLLGMVWGGSGMFSTLQQALYAVWHHERTRPFFVARLWSLLMLFLAVIFLLGSVLTTSALEIWRHRQWMIGDLAVGDLHRFWATAGVLTPFVITLAMFLCLFQAVPHPGIRFHHLLKASAIATVLWESAKQGLAWYLRNVGDLNRVYGSLTTVVVLLLWIYVAACVFLWAAELARALSGTTACRDCPRPSGA
jgi:membrane protein